MILTDGHIFEGDGRSLVITITEEGLILDAYAIDEDGNDFLVGTKGMMADEWFDSLDQSERSKP